MKMRRIYDAFINAQLSYPDEGGVLVHLSDKQHRDLGDYLNSQANAEYWSDEAIRKENED